MATEFPKRCEYHGQDDLNGCGPAVVMMILGGLGVPSNEISQEALETRARNLKTDIPVAARTEWGTTPLGLRELLNDSKAETGVKFEKSLFGKREAALGRLVGSFCAAGGPLSAAALLVSSSARLLNDHWAVIDGVQLAEEPKNQSATLRGVSMLIPGQANVGGQHRSGDHCQNSILPSRGSYFAARAWAAEFLRAARWPVTNAVGVLQMTSQWCVVAPDLPVFDVTLEIEPTTQHGSLEGFSFAAMPFTSIVDRHRLQRFLGGVEFLPSVPIVEERLRVRRLDDETRYLLFPVAAPAGPRVGLLQLSFPSGSFEAFHAMGRPATSPLLNGSDVVAAVDGYSWLASDGVWRELDAPVVDEELVCVSCRESRTPAMPFYVVRSGSAPVLFVRLDGVPFAALTEGAMSG